MTKIIIISLLFLCIPFLMWAEPYASLEAGYTVESQDLFTIVTLGYQTIWFNLYGGIETQMEFRPSGVGLCPYRSTYSLGTDLYVTSWLLFHAEHYCTHPVFSYTDLYRNKWFGENRTRFTVKIQIGGNK